MRCRPRSGHRGSRRIRGLAARARGERRIIVKESIVGARSIDRTSREGEIEDERVARVTAQIVGPITNFRLLCRTDQRSANDVGVLHLTCYSPSERPANDRARVSPRGSTKLYSEHKHTQLAKRHAISFFDITISDPKQSVSI